MNQNEYKWIAEIKSDGRVTIPKFIRTDWNLKPGDIAHFTIERRANTTVTMNNIIV